MFDLGPDFLLRLTVRLPALLAALTVHEWAHAYVAMRKGDHTAHQAGRVSFNPLVHLDPIGTIGLVFGFLGWGKPVPVDPRYLRDPRRSMVWISFAGPASNLIMAAVCGLVLRSWSALDIPVLDSRVTWYLYALVTSALIFNLFLAFFNLIPLRPLDGASVLAGFIPPWWQLRTYEQLQQFGPFILLGLIIWGGGVIFHIVLFCANPLSWLVSGQNLIYHINVLEYLFQSFR